MSKADDGLEEGHDARITESQGRDALAGHERRLLETVERVLGQHTVVTDSLNLEQFAIDLFAEIPKVRKVREPLPDPEISRVVYRDLGA
jgi:hypothetical protein